MAKFQRIENINCLPKDRIWYLVSDRLTLEDVQKINSLGIKIGLILKNTKNQSSEIISKFSPSKVQFSVIGGLDYVQKEKYRDMDYVERTLFTPTELSKIIEFFEKIERSIRHSWTDTQKCMYVYKTFTEYFHYQYDGELSYENGRDVVRSLTGIFYGKLVCSGFAQVFKEAMDRLGIPCYYQNRSNHHSWNIVKLEGKYRGIELTWDCFSKGKDNNCQFIYFGRDSKFYEDKHHDISKELEEQRYELEPFSDEELVRNIQIIKYDVNIRKAKMKQKIDNQNNKIYYLNTNSYGNIKEYFVLINNDLYTVYTDKSEDITLTKQNIEYAVNYNNGFIGNGNIPKEAKKMSTFKRHDSSTFKLYKNQKINNMYEFYCYDTVQEKDGIYFRRGVILSENDLTLVENSRIKEIIANDLLGKERLKRKMEYYHGYVGYIGPNGGLYYDRDFEEKQLHIFKRH